MSIKVSVSDWLCRRFENLNLNPSCTSEAAGLNRDQFVKPPKTLNWYEMYNEKRDFSRSKVYTWTKEPARLNSSFPKIVSHSVPSAPTSRPVFTLRKWAAHDQSCTCNQAAGLALSHQSPGVYGNVIKIDTECDFPGQVLKQATPGSR